MFKDFFRITFKIEDQTTRSHFVDSASWSDEGSQPLAS
jgi:hypothetical protein